MRSGMEGILAFWGSLTSFLKSPMIIFLRLMVMSHTLFLVSWFWAITPEHPFKPNVIYRPKLCCTEKWRKNFLNFSFLITYLFNFYTTHAILSQCIQYQCLWWWLNEQKSNQMGFRKDWESCFTSLRNAEEIKLEAKIYKLGLEEEDWAKNWTHEKRGLKGALWSIWSACNHCTFHFEYGNVDAMGSSLVAYWINSFVHCSLIQPCKGLCQWRCQLKTTTNLPQRMLGFLWQL